MENDVNIPWLKIVNKTDSEIELDIDGIIGWQEDSWPSIKKQLAGIASAKQKKLIVNIYSPGGFVADGLMIHDALKISRAKIETRVFSMSASAATLVAQSGDRRKMSSNALYLIHRAWNIAMGNANELKAEVDALEKVDERIRDIYVKKGADPDKVQKLMDENNGNGKWIDAEEALEAGLIDEIIEPSRAAAAIPSKEFFEKYKLPEIPEDLLSKLNFNNSEMKLVNDDTVDIGDAIKTEKTKTFLQGVLGSIKEFMHSGENETGEMKPDDVRDETTEDPKPEIQDKEEAVTGKPDEPGNDAPKGTIEENPEVKSLKARITDLENEIANLNDRLSDAQSRLAMADAKSTKLTGPAGKEGDSEFDDGIKEETRETLRTISKVWNGGYLENPKPPKASTN